MSHLSQEHRDLYDNSPLNLRSKELTDLGDTMQVILRVEGRIIAEASYDQKTPEWADIRKWLFYVDDVKRPDGV